MVGGSTGLHTVATCDAVQHVNAEALSKPTLFIFNIGFCLRNCVDRPLRTGKQEVLVNRAYEHGLSMRMFTRAWGMLTMRRPATRGAARARRSRTRSAEHDPSDSDKIGAARLFAGPEISSSIYGLRTKSVGNAFVPFTIYILCCLLIPCVYACGVGVHATKMRQDHHICVLKLSRQQHISVDTSHGRDVKTTRGNQHKSNRSAQSAGPRPQLL